MQYRYRIYLLIVPMQDELELSSVTYVLVWLQIFASKQRSSQLSQTSLF